MNNTKEQLLTFFRVTNAVFDVQMKIVEAFGHLPTIQPMHSLHRMALMELEKKEPDMGFVSHLLELMENTAEENAKNNKP